MGRNDLSTQLTTVLSLLQQQEESQKLSDKFNTYQLSAREPADFIRATWNESHTVPKSRAASQHGWYVAPFERRWFYSTSNERNNGKISVRVPPFWPHDLALWFSHFEGVSIRPNYFGCDQVPLRCGKLGPLVLTEVARHSFESARDR